MSIGNVLAFPTSRIVERQIREHLVQHAWLKPFSVWDSFEENQFTMEDKVNLVDFLEDLYGVEITDQELAWATTPLRLIGVIQKHLSDRQA